MDKIEKIRAEIERRREDILSKVHHLPIHRIELLDDLLSFLDTLSEEPDKSLEEAAEEYIKNGRYLPEAFVVRPAFIAGAEWQKEQMMKDAYVESQIVEDGRIELGGDPLPCLNPIILLPYPQFKPGDKVRIIIVKEG